MSAIVGQDWRPKTFRELFVQWQVVLLDRWDRTAHITAAFSASKVSLSDLNPFRRAAQTSGKITTKLKSQSLFREDLEKGEDFLERMFSSSRESEAQE